jgi:hypothetical protein
MRKLGHFRRSPRGGALHGVEAYVYWIGGLFQVPSKAGRTDQALGETISRPADHSIVATLQEGLPIIHSRRELAAVYHGLLERWLHAWALHAQFN